MFQNICGRYFTQTHLYIRKKIKLVLTEVYLRHMMDICAQGTKAEQKIFFNYYAIYFPLIQLFLVTILRISLISTICKLIRKLLLGVNKFVDPCEIKVYLDIYFKQVFISLEKKCGLSASF